jgi:hypothetical protein
MAKQLITFQPAFTPGTASNGTLDFSGYPGFQRQRLYAVINLTRNTLMYAPGVTGYGATVGQTSQGVGTNSNILYLTLDTSSYSAQDQLEIFYDTAVSTFGIVSTGDDENVALEQGGQIQQINENMKLLLVEMKVMNIQMQNMAAGLNTSYDDLNQLRYDLQQPETQEFTQ